MAVAILKNIISAPLSGNTQILKRQGQKKWEFQAIKHTSGRDI